MGNFFVLIQGKHISIFLIQVLNKVEILILLPKSFRHQKAILYIECGTRRLS